jgi:hypothetical protein
LSKSTPIDRSFVQIESLIDCSFVQTEFDKDCSFVQLLKILKAFKDTINFKDSTPSPKKTKLKTKLTEPNPDVEESDWNINALIKAVKGESIKEKIKGIPAPIFVSQILLAAASERVIDPVAVAVSNVLKNPCGWGGGVADELAVSPSYLRSEIKKHLAEGLYWSAESTPYGRLLGNVPLGRVQHLAFILGV